MRNIFRIWEKREAKRISEGAEVLKKWRTEDTFHAHKRKRISSFPEFRRRDEAISKVFLVFLVIAILSSSITSIVETANATEPLKGWSKTFGGKDDDTGRCVQQTLDGGYIIAGVTKSYGAGGYDFWLIKTDKYGNEQWNKTFGGTGDDCANWVQQTSDGGYIIVGWTESYGAMGRDPWLIKVDENGNEEWNKTFKGTYADEWANYVQQTSDGGFILAGIIGSYTGIIDGWVIKTDAYGNEKWNKTFGGKAWDEVFSVQQTSDGGYILAGYTFSYRRFRQSWLIKTDENGNEVWNKAFGKFYAEGASSVQQTSDGGYVLTGEVRSDNGDVLLIKTDANGYEQFRKKFGGIQEDFGSCVKQTSDGYIIAGYTGSYGAGKKDAWLIKTDKYGNERWNKTFGGVADDYFYSVQQTSDSGYIMVGSTESQGVGGSDLWLVRIKGTEQPTASTPKPEEAISGFEFIGVILSIVILILLRSKRGEN